MRRSTQTVWYSDGGRELLKTMTGDGEYSVIVATCDTGELAELGAAIAQALALVQARGRGIRTQETDDAD